MRKQRSGGSYNTASVNSTERELLEIGPDGFPVFRFYCIDAKDFSHRKALVRLEPALAVTPWGAGANLERARNLGAFLRARMTDASREALIEALSGEE